jgi:hypothetical protein
MRFRRLSARSGIIFGAIVLAAQPASAQPHYTYTVIADVTNCFNIGSPALGNNGEAAWVSACPTIAVRKGDGVNQTNIYVASPGEPYSPSETVISSNDLGSVAFVAQHTSGHYRVLVGNGGPLTVVADSAKQLLRASINNSGAVSYQAVTNGNSYDTVIRANGNGTFTTIAEPGQNAPGAGTILQAFESALNNAGEVEVSVNTEEGTPGVFRGSGGKLVAIAIGSGSGAGHFNGINDTGRVGFYGQVGSTPGVFTGKGGALTTIATTGSFFKTFSSVAAINNSNVVAFYAQPWSEPDGVFVGDGVLTQKVVQTGDQIDLGTDLAKVIFVTIHKEAINDNGQVAFTLKYEPVGCPGCVKYAIVRADPILPEITQLKFTSLVAGCKSIMATVALDRPAPLGGVIVGIENTNSAATTPDTLKIASNKTAGKFTIATTPVASNQIGTITATLGSSTQDKQLTVRPIGVQSVTLNPKTVVGGNPVTGTATLECAAGPNDISVALSSTKPSVAQPAVPSVVVPAGAKTMTFQVNTNGVPVNTNATIKATANGITASKKLIVTP